MKLSSMILNDLLKIIEPMGDKAEISTGLGHFKTLSSGPYSLPMVSMSSHHPRIARVSVGYPTGMELAGMFSAPTL